MPVALTHREYQAFLASLPETSWIDEVTLKVNGEEHDEEEGEELKPETVIQVCTGYITFRDRDMESKSLVTAVRAWLKKQSAITIVLELTPKQVDEFNKLAKSNGWKIIKGV